MSHRNDRNDRKAPQCGAKISVLSVLSAGQKYSFVEKLMTAGQKKLSVAASMVFVAIRIRGIAYDSNGRGWLPV